MIITRLVSFIRNLYDSRSMIRTLAIKDIRKQYTGSFLGVFWAVIHPIVMAMTYYIIFSLIFSPKVRGDYGPGGFAVYLLCGLVPWYYFTANVGRSSTLIVENKSLVTRTLFPSEIFPVISLIANSLSHLVGLLIILAVLAFSGGAVGMYILMVPLYFFLMCVMILGISWIFSSVNVFVRDAGQVLTIVLTLWFYYTPIFWPVSIVPEKMKALLMLNPFYHIVEGYRLCLMVGRMPDLGGLIYLTCFSFGVFIVGGLLFKRLKPAFADVL